ncbi:hypothetical protein VNO80_19370 [Phaseolus coccineus]|uniref:Uncharacterized protein n=1 Tax=Phaseolus coccineus TaxID=3886 RepID=A0AAN9R068_PHACN
MSPRLLPLPCSVAKETTPLSGGGLHFAKGIQVSLTPNEEQVDEEADVASIEKISMLEHELAKTTSFLKATLEANSSLVSKIHKYKTKLNQACSKSEYFEEKNQCLAANMAELEKSLEDMTLARE